MEFKKAVKAKSKLRLAIDGISGSGKTYSALAIATGIGGKIAVVDSEHGSASLYADRFEFDSLNLERFQIEDYLEALAIAADCGYEIVIIDSTSHAWDALVERVNRIAMQKFGGNSYYAWNEGTPLQRKLIEAMLGYPGHVIVTCRSKTEYSVDKDEKGKTTIKKVGTAAVQRQGFEYEFTLAMTIDANHVGMITKDRTGKFQDQFIEFPGKKFGEELVEWLSSGAEPIDEPKKEALAIAGPQPEPARERIKALHEEIKSILLTEANGTRVFSDAEFLGVKGRVEGLAEMAWVKRIENLESILKQCKEELQLRLDRMNQATQPAADREQAVNEEYEKARGKIAGNWPPAANAKPPEPAVPSMYSEPEGDEGFADDLPWAQEEALAEEDIF